LRAVSVDRLVIAMSFQFELSRTVITASAPGHERLFHGTLVCHIGGLTKGIDSAVGDSFWVTKDSQLAWWFASLAEQQLLTSSMHSKQAIFAFDFPGLILEAFLGQQPDPLVLQTADGFRFLQASFSTLNSEIKNISITIEQ
jgi:hypothetical protein